METADSHNGRLCGSIKFKTDEEIREFIDSREALTQQELAAFMWRLKRIKNSPKFVKHWNYVLETKDWERLKSYREEKITCNRTKEHYLEFLDIVRKDSRCRGKRTTHKICKLHGLNLSLSTIQRYLREFRSGRDSKV